LTRARQRSPCVAEYRLVPSLITSGCIGAVRVHASQKGRLDIGFQPAAERIVGFDGVWTARELRTGPLE
jgi:hypothetical protein